MIIAIDGPAGTGKGTIADLLAKKLGYTYIDTGAMYRCITLKMLNNNIPLNDIEKINELLESTSIEFMNISNKQHVFLDNEDVTEDIRTPRVNEAVSPTSAIVEIRKKLVEMQRKLGENQNVVMEGRDITTVVFPNADVKIYLTASPEIRAKRRYDEMIKKGISITYEDTLKSITERDNIDMNKPVGALKIADDAIVIDSSNLTIDEVYEKIHEIILEKID